MSRRGYVSDGGMGGAYIDMSPPNYRKDALGRLVIKRRQAKIDSKPPTPEEDAIARLKVSQIGRQKHRSISLPKFSWDVEEAASR